jgi:hypothetical protein
MTIAKAAIIALSAAAVLNPAMAQRKEKDLTLAKGGLYAVSTRPASGCPGLDWHINVSPDNSLSGFVAWDHQQHMAKLEGKIDRDRTFTMQAQEVGGSGRTATIKGTAGGNNVAIAISGTGTPCDDVVLNVPRVTGGLGGGGG